MKALPAEHGQSAKPLVLFGGASVQYGERDWG